jgi:hypothetical protein
MTALVINPEPYRVPGASDFSIEHFSHSRGVGVMV